MPIVRWGITGGALLSLSLAMAAPGCGEDDGPPGGPPTTSSSGGGGGGGAGGAAASCDAIPLSAELVNDGAWDLGLTIAGLAGHDGLGPGVYDFAIDATGRPIAVGRFQYAGAETVFPMVRRDGGAWEGDPSLSFEPAQPGISAIAADDLGRIAVATYSALPFALEERDGEVWLSDGGPFQPIGQFHGAVRAMTWHDGELWVGGVYAFDDGAGAPGLSVYGGGAWHEPPGGAMSGLGVFELTSHAGELYAGGSFDALGGIAAQSVAKWDGAAWTALDLGQDGTVLALARDDAGELYAGGLFSVEGSFETGGIARWTGSGWASVAGGLANSTFRGVVSDLAFHQGELYASGCFSSAGGTPSDPAAIPAADLARYTPAGWEALDDGTKPVSNAWFSPGSCGDEGPAAIWDAQQQRLLSDGPRLYAGGFFAGAGGVASQSVIAYEDGQWVAQGEPGRGLSGATRVVAAGGPDCALHTMGNLSHAGGLPVAGHVLRHGDDGWTPVGPPMPSDGYCWGMIVDDEGAPLLGCDRAVNDVDPPVGIVYALKDNAWQGIGGEIAGGGIAALALDPARQLWVAGGAAEGYVARLEGEAFAVKGAFDGRVAALAFRPRQGGGDPIEAVVGGYFTQVEGQPAGGVARWNGSAWETLGAGFPGGVLAVAYAEDGSIYASTPDDGTPDRIILGRWDGQAWHEVATPEPGPTPAGYAFSSLLARGEFVIAAGFAWPGSDERNVFVYDGATFRSLRGGATAISVEGVALARDGLWFAGTIAEVGAPPERAPSIGIAHLR